jgi:hypothetical protein
MDAEDVRQLLKRTQRHCRVLEADRDVAISRAAEYRKIILDGLAGEGGATQPQAADIFRMPVRALVCPRVIANSLRLRGNYRTWTMEMYTNY